MSFRLKTVIGIAIIEATLLALLVFSGLNWLRDSNTEQLSQRAQTTARALATSLSQRVRSRAGRDIWELLGTAMTDQDLLYIRVLDARGRVLAARGDSAALATTFRPDSRPDTVDDGIFDVAEPVLVDGRVLGRVEVGYSTEALLALLAEARSKGLSIAALEMILVAIFSIMLGTWLTRQLNRLREGAERIAEEGPGVQLPESGDSELSRVAIAFNRMSRQLADSYAALREALSESRALMMRVTESEHQKRQLVDTALDGIVSIDGDARVLDYNPSAERLFGFARAEVVGRPLDACFAGMDLPSGTDPGQLLFGTAADDVSGQRRELSLPTKDGRQLELEITNTRWCTDRGEYRTAFMRDVSERKRYQAILEDAARRAREANAAKSRFLAAMSHEIRTPLNAILNMNDLLLESQLDEEQRGYAATASDSARALLSIVNGVLDFSKIEAGRIEPAPLPTDPEEITREVVALLAARAYAKDVQLTMFCDPLVPLRMETDPGLLRQILLNLIGNAIKFTEAGAVRIRLAVDKEGTDARVLRIDVIDTGIGIAADKQSDLFQEFVQADGSSSRKYGGSGLGLAISRRLARVLGGDIGLTSAPGEGSRFTLKLPIVNQGAEEPGRWALAEHLRGWRLHITIDNAAVAEDLAAQLRAYGVAVEVLPHGLALRGGCCGEIRMTPLDEHGGVGAASTRRVLLYLIGSRCQPETDGAIAALRIPVAPSDLIGRLTAATTADAPIEDERDNDDLDQRIARCAATALPILLAEDSRANQLVATTMLRKAGFRVDIAENGLQAVAAVNRRGYSLVLMDLAMPEMDGLEATGCIRALPGKRGRLPIIAMTANVFAEDRQRCLDAGMDDYLSKPIERSVLLETILHWLETPPGARAHRAPSAIGHADRAVAALPPTPQPIPDPMPQPAALAPQPGDAYSASSDAEPVEAIDEQVITALAASLSAELMPAVVRTFIVEAHERIRNIEDAVASGDVVRAGAEGHALKGSAATFGATALRDIATLIDKAGRTGDMDPIRASLQLLRVRGDEVVRALETRYRPEASVDVAG